MALLPALAASVLLLGPSTRPASESSTLELQIAPLPDLHFAVRAAARDEIEPLEIEGFGAAVAAATACDDTFQHPVAWALVDTLFLAAPDVATARGIAERLPESRRLGERDVPIRAPLLAYLETLVPVEPRFVEEAWPKRRERLVAAKRTFVERLDGASSEPLPHLCAALGFDDPGGSIPVHLTIASPAPGGVTLRSRSGPICCVSLDARDPSTLAEVILHEATHAIDASPSSAPDSIPALLRAALVKRGLDSRADTNRHAGHTLFFLQAAETVRACLDPDHIDVGITSGYYERVGAIAKIEREIWAEHTLEPLAAEALVERLADAVLALANPPEKESGKESEEEGGEEIRAPRGRSSAVGSRAPR